MMEVGPDINIRGDAHISGLHPADTLASDHNAQSLAVDLDAAMRQVADMLSGLAQSVCRNFHNPTEVSLKSDGSVVTVTDKLVHETLRPSLRVIIPHSYYLGEEGPEATEAYYQDAFSHEFVWAVDEIDGTQNFSRGLKDFAISVGLLQRGESGHVPVHGAILFPAQYELYYSRGSDVILRNLLTGTNHVVTPRNNVVVGSRILAVQDDFFERHTLHTEADPKLTPRIFGCVVSDIINTATGKCVGAYTDAHIWDFAGSLALARRLGVEMRDMESGQIKSTFSAQDFVQGVPHRAWCLPNPMLVSNAENTKHLIDSIVIR